jgi:hypothetical protein
MSAIWNYDPAPIYYAIALNETSVKILESLTERLIGNTMLKRRPKDGYHITVVHSKDTRELREERESFVEKEYGKYFSLKLKELRYNSRIAAFAVDVENYTLDPVPHITVRMAGDCYAAEARDALFADGMHYSVTELEEHVELLGILEAWTPK